MSDLKPVNLSVLRDMRAQRQPIACLTAYDASFAAVADAAGVDVILIGDSLGMVIQGRDTTTAVTTADLVYHSRCVTPSLRRAFAIADMPFLSFATRSRALDSAQRLMQDGGAAMVKLEGNREQARIVDFLSTRGVPVCAHLGLQPQLIHKMGRFRVQGRETAAADAMRRDARLLEDAGADMLLLECVPAALAQSIREAASVPVIGIGAGPDVDGQILVLYDVLGISAQSTSGRPPRFARNFMSGQGSIQQALADYVAAVRDGSYPAPEHCF